ncbi:phage tail spike protein [Clostridium perfringens]|nr:phage tail spike protein [Clostridium perfringens]
MINIYDSTETKFSHNGICSLDEKRELIKCTIHRKLEGAYEGTLFISKENLKWTEFIEGRILKLPVDINGRTQLFRIFDTSDDFNDLEVYFKHIFFDLDDFFIEDTNIVEKDGRGAINQILNTTIDSHRFTATSDINIINNCRIVDKTVTEAIGVDENCFLNRWGGEIDYDNFKFRINEKIGSDNGYRIALRKNLKAINGDISITEVATKLKIKGYDGIKLDEYLISPLANAYPHFKTRVVKFDDIKVKSDPNNPEEEGYETLQAAQLEMKRRGLELFSKQNIDKPTVNFEIDIDEMREENIEVGVLEVLSIGDIATLELEDFLRSNIEVKQRVIELEFDCIRKINIKVILGESTSTIFKEVSKIESMLNDLNDKLEGNSWQDILDQSMGQATDIIAEGFKDSHVIPRKNEIIVADNIDLNLAKKVIVINKNGIGFSLDGYRPDRLTLAMTIDGEINASCIKFGLLQGSLIDARNIRVTDGRGNETLNIDSSGNVSLNVKNLKVNSKDVATSTQLQQLNDNFNFKVSNTGSENLILNSNFDAEFKKWELHGRPTLSTHNPHLSPRYGKMVTIQSTGGGEGIYQRFPTIPGQKYTVSFYAESDELRPLHTTIGIEDVHLITLVYEPGFKRWHFTFEATEKQHTFIAYLGESGKFYIGRVMVNQGEQLQEYRKYTSEIYSTNVKFDIDGMEIDSTNAGTKNRIDAEGMKILNKSDNSVLLEIIQNMIRAKGGAFIVDHKEQGYTKLWGRDIEINGQRALVGTNSKTQSPLKPNKLYVNYNNDFINGVEIAGELTNNTKKIISVHDSSLNENGFVFLSNGLKLQWGKVTINIQNGKVIEGTVNFPTPFPGACIIFQANLESVDNNNYWSANYNIVSKPLNRFAGGIYGLNLQKYIEQQGAVAQLSWFAIGV